MKNFRNIIKLMILEIQNTIDYLREWKLIENLWFKFHLSQKVMIIQENHMKKNLREFWVLKDALLTKFHHFQTKGMLFLQVVKWSQILAFYHISYPNNNTYRSNKAKDHQIKIWRIKKWSTRKRIKKYST